MSTEITCCIPIFHVNIIMDISYGITGEINNNIGYWDSSLVNMLSPESPEPDMEESTQSTGELDDNSLLEIFSYLSMRDIMNAAKGKMNDQ